MKLFNHQHNALANGRQQGSALLAVIIMLPFLIFIIALYMGLSVASYKNSRADQSRTHAQFATDAGTDYAVQQIADDADWTGTTSPVEVHNDGSIKTTFEVTVEDVDADTKTITSTGKTYNPITATTPKNSVTIKTDLRRVTSGDYSIVTGVGGLYMSNSAKVLGGDVLINGELSMTGTSQIGLSTAPANVEVAHQICPNPATSAYPTVCASGENGEPISIANPAHIYGTVRANNQTTTARMSDPGLTASSGVTPQSLPVHDRDAQKAAAATTVTAASAGCNSGTKSWAANTKITGNLVVSGTCQVTVNGDVWITGTVDIKNSARLIVADSLGATRPTLMIDGSLAQFRNSALLNSNATGTGFQVVTYRSDPSCSPDCANVTGTDLYNSRNLMTISLEQSSSAPNTIFYAKWSRVTVANTGQIGALIGQTVELTNSGTITFGTSVGVGTEFWVIDNYRRTFN